MQLCKLHQFDMNDRETIRLDNLSIGYRNGKNTRTVTSGINASLNSGCLTCLLGANGIGKSTLLRTLSGFQPKLSGKIIIRSREIEDYSKKELSRLIGVVLTSKPDVRNMSVAELVGLGRSPYTGFWGNLSEEDNAIVSQSISMVGIEKLSDRTIHTLSDGERQKVMIAKALAQETPVIFLDEPTAFLDFPSKVEMMQLLKQLTRDTGKTIFLSTHDMSLALQIADCIWLMHNNELSIGSPRELAEKEALANFIERDGIIFDKETLTIRIKQ